MTLSLSEGKWGLTVKVDHLDASFLAAGSVRESESAHINEDPVGEPIRAVLELAARSGVLRPRAIIGGVFAADNEAKIQFVVNHSGDLGNGLQADCLSMASGRPYVRGLPSEFAQAVTDGLTRVKCSLALPSGTLRVDRAAHDEVESSQLVFEKAGGILRCVLAAKYRGVNLNEGEMRALLG